MDRLPIRLIALDLDGTLLTSAGKVSARTAEAIRAAQRIGVVVVLATGKTRASAAAVMAELDLSLAGVFNQGLMVYGSDGSTLRQTSLAVEVVAQVCAFTTEHNLSIHAYSGERLLTPIDNPDRYLLQQKFQEPLAEIVGPLSMNPADGLVNKLLIGDEVHNGSTRKQLAALVREQAQVIQAVPEFIEVVPPGTSKGDGLACLLQHYGLPPGAVMAVGDGENDVEMLQLVGVGVAMGNAVPVALAAADYQVAGQDEDGVAEAITRFVLETAN